MIRVRRNGDARDGVRAHCTDRPAKWIRHVPRLLASIQQARGLRDFQQLVISRTQSGEREAAVRRRRRVESHVVAIAKRAIRTGPQEPHGHTAEPVRSSLVEERVVIQIAIRKARDRVRVDRETCAAADRSLRASTDARQRVVRREACRIRHRASRRRSRADSRRVGDRDAVANVEPVEREIEPRRSRAIGNIEIASRRAVVSRRDRDGGKIDIQPDPRQCIRQREIEGRAGRIRRVLDDDPIVHHRARIHGRVRIQQRLHDLQLRLDDCSSDRVRWKDRPTVDSQRRAIRQRGLSRQDAFVTHDILHQRREANHERVVRGVVIVGNADRAEIESHIAPTRRRAHERGRAAKACRIHHCRSANVTQTCWQGIDHERAW